MRPTIEQIGARLAAAFPGSEFEVIDESHLHAGHAGARGGAGHFRVRIASRRFDGLATLARHRLVYDSVRDWMPDRIHALSIDARLPGR
ncbi:MAG: BolA/IbaG family iron-sulfur metabolism protein [Burkholderiaceae bacterium]|nr:BolA/IbaG family iron-sulfur metabolism protein [Burkholderiaceae bacterium]